MKRIAVIGAGTAGLVQCIALKKKLGPNVEVHLFDKDPVFDVSRGVELSIGTGFQVVMAALDVDCRADLQRYGDVYYDACALSPDGTPLTMVEEIINATGIYTGASGHLPNGVEVALNAYSVNRGIFMEILHNKLQQVFGHDIVQWNHRLTAMTPQGAQYSLQFDTGRKLDNVDLVIGADGVHSLVRHALLDQKQARHVGANIVYGIIEGEVDYLRPERFNIICDNAFSMVAYTYKTQDLRRQTWWAIVYHDPKDHVSPADHRAFWEASGDAKAYARRLIADTAADSLPRRYVEATTEFKYSGFFLERDPCSLTDWGRGNGVVIGDAAHAMQPWAGIGATLAAEDAYVLAGLLAQHGLEDLPSVFDRLRKERLDRVCYSYHLTLNNTPEGLLPEDLSRPIDWIINRFGDHRPLTSSPAWLAFASKQSYAAA